MTRIAVLDIGKTNVKLALVDRASLAEIAVVTRPNLVLPGPPWPHMDLDGHWAFLLDGLRRFQASHGVDAISISAHGASGVLLDARGQPAAPMPDYEDPGPDDLAAAYDALRPPFAVTGSPRLPGGLNLGAQLHRMLAQDPGLRARIATIVTYPQYWAHRLTGIAATERTSLGCHTDLWEPARDAPSPLLAALGLEGRLAPLRLASDILGPVTEAVAARTGLPATTPVACGIHDSNASLLPHLMSRPAPFSVVSTGTWIVSMAVGGAPPALDPGRDTLLNVDARGRPLPSARFMGGREFDLATLGRAVTPTQADIAATLAQPLMLLPAIVAGSGPYRGRAARWLPGEPEAGSGRRSAAASFHAALMTRTCLGLIGHRGPVIVEGPFARNEAYLAMLAAAMGAPVIAAEAATGTAPGAALLVPGPAPRPAGRICDPGDPAPFCAYAERWQASV